MVGLLQVAVRACSPLGGGGTRESFRLLHCAQLFAYGCFVLRCVCVMCSHVAIVLLRPGVRTNTLFLYRVRLPHGPVCVHAGSRATGCAQMSLCQPPCAIIVWVPSMLRHAFDRPLFSRAHVATHWLSVNFGMLPEVVLSSGCVCLCLWRTLLGSCKVPPVSSVMRGCIIPLACLGSTSVRPLGGLC